MKQGRAAICILPCLFVLTNESGWQGLSDWCSSTYIPLIPQNSIKVTGKKPVVSKLSFLSSGSLTENNVVMANGEVLKTTIMGLGTEKMLGSYAPSDEWASITCELLVCLVLYLWYILISCQKLVELLVLPMHIQMLWHKMTPKESRRDGSGVSARAPLEPACWAFHWEGQVEVLLWWLLLCFSLLAFTQRWIRAAEGAVIARLPTLLLTSAASLTEALEMSLWGHMEVRSWKRIWGGKFWKVTLFSAQAMEREHPAPSSYSVANTSLAGESGNQAK